MTQIGGDDTVCDYPTGLNRYMSSDSQSRLLVSRSAFKRDRPLSSYFDSPSHTQPIEVSDYFNLKDNEIKQLQIKEESDRDEDDQEYTSPLVNRRKPFRNLTNFVNSLEFGSMKKKLSSSKKTLTRSMTLVAKSFREEHEKTLPLEDELENKCQDGLKSDVYREVSDIGGSPTLAASRNKSIRRIHSMCQTSKEKETYNMEDNSNLCKTAINTFKVDNDLLPRISHDELFKILRGDYEGEFDEYVVIDCRFNYEYEGGHIINAINVTSQQDLEDKFIKEPVSDLDLKRRLYIFHCEFSIFRSPTIASHLRKCDRILNSNNYPKLNYPDIVILEGGYKGFFDKHKAYCHPQAYVEMKDVNYQKACELEMSKVRLAKKLPRAKSYNHFLGNDPLLNTHNRSNSFTTITSHAENLKILKMKRSTSKFNLNNNENDNEQGSTWPHNKLTRASTFAYTPSVFNSSPSNHSNSIGNHGLDDDFQPPPALFKMNSHNKSLSNSSNISTSSTSINSSSSSLCSDLQFSSTESLTDSYSSPVGEFSDFFESKPSNLSSYLKNNNHSSLTSLNLTRSSINSLRKSSVPANQRNTMSSNMSNTSIASDTTIVNQNSKNLPNSSFKFPVQSSSKKKMSRNLSRINTNTKHSSQFSNNSIAIVTSSPIINSPLSTATPISTIESTSRNALSIIDPINDSPVDFSVPSSIRRPRDPRRRSGSLLSSGGSIHKYLDLNIDEVDEDEEDEQKQEGKEVEVVHDDETVEDSDKTLTEIELINRTSNFSQKSPFN